MSFCKQQVLGLFIVGLGFLGFVSACYELARRRFYAPTKQEMLKSLVDFCQENIKIHSFHTYGASGCSSVTASLSPYSTITATPTSSFGGGSQQQPCFPAPQPPPHHHHSYRHQRHLGRRERHKTSLTLFPRSTITTLEGEESQTRNRLAFEQSTPMLGGPGAYNSVAFRSRRQQSFMGDGTSIMRESQARTYLPRTLTHSSVFPDNDE
ncbi:tubulin polyglutamylase ttll11 [Plakobranchus ocellatus]|uniref:Tubulin polyglutamylase ttll11 n=1 Tax=Plakobranchus ocellatus TaxID=259542 RepID=A0AAV3XRM5_9GAST|nr:tubulin polyglutamylase ttll11 [Plakobranchus ocellatus]